MRRVHRTASTVVPATWYRPASCLAATVPSPRPSGLASVRTSPNGRFFYQLYFQDEGVAEAEFEADIRTALRTVYFNASGDRNPADTQARAPKDPDANYLSGLSNPDPFPDWLTDEDLDYYVEAFMESGFRGPLNRYRAQQRDWELLPELSELTISQPSYFIAGSLDPVRNFIPGADMYENPGSFCADFRGATIIDGEGHWVQQEAPEAVNRALLGFLGQI